MQWGISFKIPAAYESDLWDFPPPSAMQRLNSINGRQMIKVFYHFQFTPQSWKEWQRVASIKIQMQKRVNAIMFDDYEAYEAIGCVYTVSSLGKHFKAFVKFPKPQYPSEHREAYKMLCRHAKRLHRDTKLHIEQLIATSMRFNDVDSNKEGLGQTFKRAKAAYKFAMDHREAWPTRLNEEERHKVLSMSAHKAAEAKRNNPKRNEAKELQKSGMLLNEIAETLSVSRSTLWRWLK